MASITERVYNAFASLISIALLIGTMAVIALATAAFLRLVADVTLSSNGEVSYRTLQTLFDQLLGAIIALELAHSVQLMASGQRGLAQVRIVLVIGILAVVRKLIVIDLDAVTGSLLFGLAAAVLALGTAFALLAWMEWRTGKVDED